MKKSIWLAAGVAVMLFGSPVTDVQGAVNLQIHSRNGNSFVLESRPSFVMLPEQGFSVAVGSPYDIVFYGNRYYINQNGSWYRSSSYRGPWSFIKTKHLPSRIRRHRLEEIRGFRDTEYRKNDNRRALEQQRGDENNRRVLEQQRGDENNRRILEQQRGDENNRRILEQQRSDENNRRTLEQQRSDQNRK
jgi:hypothetical protein